MLIGLLLTSLVPLAEAQVTTNADANGNTTVTTGPQLGTESSQPPTNSTPQSFFVSVEHYFTQANTNYSWTSNRFEFSTGGDYMSGLQWANYLEWQVDFGAFSVLAKVRNIGIAGAIEGAEGGVGYTVIAYYSVKVEGDLLLGYDFTKDSALVEPQIVVKNKMTKNTYIETGISEPVWLRGAINRTPDFFLGAGFTY